MIRDTIKAAQINAMKAGEKDRLAAVRLILAKIKDRDIELRTASQLPDDDAMVVEVMQKMIKQRQPRGAKKSSPLIMASSTTSCAIWWM